MKKVILNYLNHLALGTTQHYRNMAVFPLLSDKEVSCDYLLLDDALEAELVEIREVDEVGSVPELKVENKSFKHLLILDGEELVGAKQNRIVNVTMLIAAYASLTIPVSCVEQGRWSYQGRRFMSKERVMPSMMRMMKSVAVHDSLDACGKFSADQGEIWDMIDEKKARHKADAPTSAMGDIYDHEQDITDDYMKHFTVKDTQVGMLVMINNQVIGCDCFSRHDTLSKCFAKLIQSYVLDAIDVIGSNRRYTFPKGKASGFIDDIKGCLVKERSSISLGTDVRLASRKVIGSALSLKNELIHLTAFAREGKEKDRKIRFYQRASRRKRI